MFISTQIEEKVQTSNKCLVFTVLNIKQGGGATGSGDPSKTKL